MSTRQYQLKPYPTSKEFDEVCSLVKAGIPAVDAFKKLGLNGSTFYKKITVEQKKELRLVTSLTKAGTPVKVGSKLPRINKYFDRIIEFED